MACQVWPLGQFHQSFLWLPKVTSSGVRGALRSASHWESRFSFPCAAQYARNVCRIVSHLPQRKNCPCGKANGAATIAMIHITIATGCHCVLDALGPSGFASLPFGRFARKRNPYSVAKMHRMALPFSFRWNDLPLFPPFAMAFRAQKGGSQTKFLWARRDMSNFAFSLVFPGEICYICYE